MYQEQLDDGRLFLHEHPFTAASWNEPCLQAFLARNPSVIFARGDQCCSGMMSEDAEGIGSVLKPTGWMTNSECLAAELGERCANAAIAAESSQIDLEPPTFRLPGKGTPGGESPGG